MFWSYTVETGFETNLKVGDTIDLTSEEVYFGQADTCNQMETNFKYAIQANFPVQGP
jgi:hypothetical protein